MDLKRFRLEVHSSFSFFPRRWTCRSRKRVSAPWLLISSLVSWFSIAALADSAILFSGVPVDLRISEVSEKTLRIELIDPHGNPAAPSPTLTTFPAKERFHSRDLA